MSREATRDFARQPSLAPRHLQRLRLIHQRLASELAGPLSALVRTRVEVQLAEVKPLEYGEFLNALATPSCFHLLKSEGLEDCLMLDIEPKLLFPMIDRLLGGGQQEGEAPPRRPLSDIELLLAGRIARVFLEHLSKAWGEVCDLKVDIVQAETNPRLLRALPADEMVVSICFRVAMGSTQGLMRLCVPSRAAQRAEGMSAAGLAAQQSSPLSVEDQARLDALGLQESLAEVEVTLATTSISMSDLQSLRVGDIVATETPADRPAVVSINRQAKFEAKPGACQGQKAVCVTEAIHNDPSSQK